MKNKILKACCWAGGVCLKFTDTNEKLITDLDKLTKPVSDMNDILERETSQIILITTLYYLSATIPEIISKPLNNN